MTSELMENFLKDELVKKLPKIGQIIKGKILSKKGSSIYIDIDAYQTGIIYGLEYYEARDILKNYQLGDEIVVKIKEIENEEGLIELSLKEAGEQTLFENLRDKMKNKETISVKIKGANKGGLIAEVGGLPAFLPASQLSSENYPKVDEASPTKIAQLLNKFVGLEMDVIIIGVDQVEKKVVISQKEIERELTEAEIKKYEIGEIIAGKISGFTDFGVFVSFKTKTKNYDYEGLVPMTETINKESLKSGDEIKTKVINKEGSRLFLSMKL